MFVYVYKARLTFRDRIEERYSSDDRYQWKTVDTYVITDVNPGHSAAYEVVYRAAVARVIGKDVDWNDWMWSVERIEFVGDGPLVTRGE